MAKYKVINITDGDGVDYGYLVTNCPIGEIEKNWQLATSYAEYGDDDIQKDYELFDVIYMLQKKSEYVWEYQSRMNTVFF